jgi:DNA-directed RNA polymerase subunit RPC12/RpoP
MLPFILVIVAFLIICIYSLIRSRKIAKFYSEVLVTKNFKSTTTIFCPNCGNKRIKAENFCKTCGQELK